MDLDVFMEGVIQSICYYNSKILPSKHLCRSHDPKIPKVYLLSKPDSSMQTESFEHLGRCTSAAQFHQNQFHLS